MNQKFSIGQFVLTARIITFVKGRFLKEVQKGSCGQVVSISWPWMKIWFVGLDCTVKCHCDDIIECEEIQPITPESHRVWFKVIFNPIMRLFGCHIVSIFEEGTLIGYAIRRVK
jgi:hypothetical protein